MSEFQQNAVSQTTWSWTRKAAAVRPARKSRAVQALIQSLIMALIAGVLIWVDKTVMSRIVLSIAGVVLLSGLFIPPLFHAIERFGKALGTAVGVGMTWLLLVPFFYICFVPARLILLLRGKDPMNRACPTNQPSYWIKRTPVTDMNHYRKPF